MIKNWLWNIDSRFNLIDLLHLIVVITPFPMVCFWMWVYDLGLMDNYTWGLYVSNWIFLEFFGGIYIIGTYYGMRDIRKRRRKEREENENKTRNDA